MRKVGFALCLVGFLAVCSLTLGLLTRLRGTWTEAWKAAAGCFAVSLLWNAARFIPKSSPWSRRTMRVLVVGVAAGAIAVTAGAAGEPYRWLGVGTLLLLITELWATYRRTTHYLERENTGPMRLFEWLVFFKDPDGLDVKKPVAKPAPDAERAGR